MAFLIFKCREITSWAQQVAKVAVESHLSSKPKFGDIWQKTRSSFSVSSPLRHFTEFSTCMERDVGLLQMLFPPEHLRLSETSCLECHHRVKSPFLPKERSPSSSLSQLASSVVIWVSALESWWTYLEGLQIFG